MAESLRVWCYVLAKDVGIAPCIDDAILTLCTCKPGIRKGARVGDWVLATLPKRFGVGRVAYVARVAEVIETGAFAERWPDRADALYARMPDGSLAHRGGAYHAEPELVARDLQARRCLRFDPFWYFGGDGPVLPESLLDMCHYFVGQTTHGLQGRRLLDFEQWLAARPPGIAGAPREAAEGARWRAQMPYLRGSGAGRSGPRDGGGSHAPIGTPGGLGGGPSAPRRPPRPRSC